MEVGGKMRRVFLLIWALWLQNALAKQWSSKWNFLKSDRRGLLSPSFNPSIRGGSDDEPSPSNGESSVVIEQPREEEEIASESIPVTVEDQHDAGKTSPFHFSVYQPGDGSEEDPDKIPRRFLLMQKDDRESAKACFAATVAWRQDHQVDTILARPHPNYDICKAITLHSFLGHDATGHVVFFQRPAMDSGEHLTLAKKNHMNNDELLLHYVYVLEYCWNVLDPPVPGQDHKVMTSIVDLTGLELSILRHRELVGFIKQFVSMMSTHYPQRSYKTLILNAPSWFGALYKLISPMLRDSTKEKVQILSHGQHQVEVLREVLGEDCLQYLPPDVLETDKKKYKKVLQQSHHTSLPKSPIEQQLREFCCERLKEAGLEMNTIII